MLEHIVKAFTFRECDFDTPMTRLARIEYTREYEYLKKHLGRLPRECEVRHLVGL